MYDYLIVGSGLFGSVFAHEAKKKGYKCLVVEKRDHIGGNIYTYELEGINIHRYGAHIFHTSNKEAWDYINQFATFNNFVNSPIAFYKDELYNLPFNMNTFSKMWGIRTPQEAEKIISEQRKEVKKIENLEDQAISLVGRDIYEKLIKGYTEKQWGRSCTELPPEIIKRLPVRYTYNNNYFNDIYQGIPIGGYTQIIEKLLDGIEVRLNTDFCKEKEELSKIANKILYTGALDAYFDYSLGNLQYRSEKFELERLEEENHQGVAVVNYTEREVPYTRIIEHKHFENSSSPVTYISKEYPVDYSETGEPYYPINDKVNTELYNKYRELAKNDDNLLLGGRLALYSYFDMDKTIIAALELVKNSLD
ncbi:UDP-galactopyranose mutase [Bullifex sp.]|uniref:UDP-galactopyranose mutase n=1 Tax=Bullifex sp. TaxID=2815808 RepID=UPI002A807792|nr:UDP-galactopyranose mutase [Bullifex sp.]MDY4066394.1 UDP-galactopyranose mutase [Bullifex sp.]